MARNDRFEEKTLTQIENDDWGMPLENLAPSKQRVLQLRYERLDQMTDDDIRLLVNYGVGLPYVMPLAIDILRRDPFVEGSHYPGDLLNAVFRTSAEFYGEFPDYWSQIHVIAEEAQAALKRLGEDNIPKNHVEDGLQTFLANEQQPQRRKPKAKRKLKPRKTVNGVVGK